MKYLIDAWAWVAYLDGGAAGEKVNEILLFLAKEIRDLKEKR